MAHHSLQSITQGLWRAAAALALAGGAALAPVPVVAQSGSTYVITDVNPSKFPTVTFRLRAIDANNRAITGLSASNLALYENGQLVPAQNVKITAKDDGPMTIIYVVDFGARQNFQSIANQVRLSISRLTEGGFFVEGRDTVKVLSRENVNGDRTEVVVNATQKRDDLVTWLGREDFTVRSRGTTRGLEGVNDAIRDMDTLVPVPGSRPTNIILISRGIEDPAPQVAAAAARNTAADAKSRSISIHALQTDQFGNKEPLQALAAVSNGQYVVVGGNIQSDADNLYRAIAGQRLYYEVTYTSATGDAGARKLGINSATQPIVGTTSFNISPQAPAVTIDDPANEVVLRREPLTQTPNSAYPPLRRKVSATVKFTDGFNRAITSAQLIVDGKVNAAQPVIAGTKIDFDADLSTASVTPGRKPVRLEVRVKDALNIESTARVDIFIEVIAPPSPTPPPTATPVPEGVTVSTPALLGAAAGVIALVAVGGILAYVIARKRRTSSVREQKTIAVSPLSGSLATLTVLEGPRELLSTPIRLLKERTVIGRNPQGTDIQFYADRESSISRVHCTVTKLPTGSFQLMDNGSSAGTFLNGRKLQPNLPTDLMESDEIVLGDLARRGIKLRFSSGGGDANVIGGSDRTRLVR